MNYQQKYYKENKEKVNKRNREYYHKNREKISASKKQNNCIDCGILIWNGSIRCKRCAYKSLKGWKHTKETKDKLRIAKLNEQNPMWKGNGVSLTALHTWIKARKPKPKFCERCNKRKVYDLANISQEYKRDVSDYEWLCRKCHMEGDGRLEKLREFGKKDKFGENNPRWKGGISNTYKNRICEEQARKIGG